MVLLEAFTVARVETCSRSISDVLEEYFYKANEMLPVIIAKLKLNI